MAFPNSALRISLFSAGNEAVTFASIIGITISPVCEVTGQSDLEFSNFNIEESQSYLPGSMPSTDINNDREVHIFKIERKRSSKITITTQEKYGKNDNNNFDDLNDSK